VPAAVIAFAARLLPAIAPGMSVPTSVRDDPGSLELVGVRSSGLWPAVLDAVRKALVEEGSIGLVVPDGWATRAARTLADAGIEHAVAGAGVNDDELPPRVTVLPATTAKGLEYDRVVVVEPAQIADDEPDVRTGLRRLYVVLTRAVSGLAVVHARPLPAELTA
jgi:hypothetical protein